MDFSHRRYRSGSCSALLPSCILVPKSTPEVAAIIRVLNTNKEKFAVKSGGHNPNKGFSSIQGGPLISLKALNQVSYDAVSSTAKIGPGNRWSDVAKFLEPHGVVVASGRVGHVGVGGYLSGGGLSYLSTQHGWAANTIKEVEVVLASGEVVTASATANTDLFKAVRGGGNNFGIVTSFTLKAFPSSTIWGGQLIFVGEDKAPALLSAVRNFTENYPDDRAAIIVTSFYNSTSSSVLWITFLFWDGPTPPEGLFADIFAVGPIMNTWAQTSYYDFVSALGNTVITGESVQISTETTPLPSEEDGAEVFKTYFDYYLTTSKKYAHIKDLHSWMTWQPIPKRLAAHTIAAGGDLLALDADHDRIMFELHITTPSPSTDVQVAKISKEIFTGLKTRVDGFVKAGKLADVHRPLFMNDANWQQDYFGRLGKETRKFLKAARQKYDPKGLFKNRTAGFKL